MLYLLWYFLNFLNRQVLTYCSSFRRVDGFSNSKSISISSRLLVHMVGSEAWRISTTRASFMPGRRLMSRLSWCFSSYVIGKALLSESRLSSCVAGKAFSLKSQSLFSFNGFLKLDKVRVNLHIMYRNSTKSIIIPNYRVWSTFRYIPAMFFLVILLPRVWGLKNGCMLSVNCL